MCLRLEAKLLERYHCSDTSRLHCLSSTGSNHHQGAALSGISPPCFSQGSCGPGSWRTPTRSWLGSAGPTTTWWRNHCSYSWPLESFCKWRHDHKQELFVQLFVWCCTCFAVHLLFCAFFYCGGKAVNIVNWNIWVTVPESCLFLLLCFFRVVIYCHTQVVDGQRRIISQLEKQIENVCRIKHFSKQEYSHASGSVRQLNPNINMPTCSQRQC